MMSRGEVEHRIWRVFKVDRVMSTLLLGNRATITAALSSKTERCQRPKIKIKKRVYSVYENGHVPFPALVRMTERSKY